MESNNFVNYLKQNGVSARRLAYCENNCDFKFYLSTENGFYSIDDGKLFNGNGFMKNVFQPLFNDEEHGKEVLSYTPITSRFVYGNLKNKIEKYLLKDMQLINEKYSLVKMTDMQFFDYDKLIKIENKINSLKNLESNM